MKYIYPLFMVLFLLTPVKADVSNEANDQPTAVIENLRNNNSYSNWMQSYHEVISILASERKGYREILLLLLNEDSEHLWGSDIQDLIGPYIFNPSFRFWSFIAELDNPERARAISFYLEGVLHFDSSELERLKDIGFASINKCRTSSREVCIYEQAIYFDMAHLVSQLVAHGYVSFERLRDNNQIRFFILTGISSEENSLYSSLHRVLSKWRDLNAENRILIATTVNSKRRK